MCPVPAERRVEHEGRSGGDRSVSTSQLLAGDDSRLGPSAARRTAIEFLDRAGLTGAADADRVAILEHVRRHPDIAERTCRPGHLTGSGLVVDPTGQSTLLLLHAKLGLWLQPGGHADGDTNLAAVALREATEETGIAGLRIHPQAIDVDVHEVRPPDEDQHLHLDVRFLVVAPEDAREVGNDESLALRWVTEAELDHLEPTVDDSTRRLVAIGLRAARRLAADPIAAVAGPDRVG